MAGQAKNKRAPAHYKALLSKTNPLRLKTNAVRAVVHPLLLLRKPKRVIIFRKMTKILNAGVVKKASG